MVRVAPDSLIKPGEAGQREMGDREKSQHGKRTERLEQCHLGPPEAGKVRKVPLMSQSSRRMLTL